MKKHFYLFILFFAVTLGSQAQIKKGAILLGGTLGFGTSKGSTYDNNGNLSDKQSTTDVTLSPSIGKAIKDNLVAGFDLSYEGYKNNQGSDGGYGTTTTTRGYGAGMFLRRYIPLGSGFAIFMQTRLGGTYNTQKYTSNGGAPYPYTDGKWYSIDLSFYPGVAYAITKRVQLETGFANLVDVNYVHNKNTTASGGSNNVISTTKSNGFGISTSLTSQVGFAVGIKVLLGS